MSETIGHHMTSSPHSIGVQQPLARAITRMREHGVRHLPVLNGGEVVGMLSDRDMALLEGVSGGTRDDLTVGDVMSPEPYAVSKDTPFSTVLREMAARRLGSAVVLEAGHVVGIYTSTDAVRTLAERTQDTPSDVTTVGKRSYGLVKTLGVSGFEEAVDAVTEALRSEGFGVLTEIDVKETLKKKIDRPFRRYVILGACNPELAYRALQAEPHIGLLLPCNVVVQETRNDVVEVSIANPSALFDLVGNAGARAIAEEVQGRLTRVLNALDGGPDSSSLDE